MQFRHFTTTILTVVIAAACSREQPSAMPATAPAQAPPPAAATPTAIPPPPVATGQYPVTEPIAPPPLDEQIAPFTAIGYTVCDEFFEKARQCINTRLSPDERAVQGTELRNSVRLVGASAQGGMKSERIEQTCKRLRALSMRKLAKHGCTDL